MLINQFSDDQSLKFKVKFKFQRFNQFSFSVLVNQVYKFQLIFRVSIISVAEFHPSFQNKFIR